jgi:CRP/FNR family transcriptional regulator, cyclic AMP receptor protein
MGPAGPRMPGIVIAGDIRLMIRSADGREAMINGGGRGTVYGLFTLFPSQPPSMKVERSIVAGAGATVIHLDRAALLNVANKHCSIGLGLAERLFVSASLITDTVAEYAFMSVRQRLAAHLLSVATEEADVLKVDASQRELATAVGSAREVVARILGDLRAQGAIAVGRRSVTILDPGRISAAAAL